MLKNLTNSFKGDNLKAKCARSGVVLGIGAFLAKGLNFLSKVILTRLLAPEAMGLMVLILSMTALFEVLTEVGIKQSVIQNKKGAQPGYLNVAWWFQSLRGIGLYSIAFIVSPWICSFYFDKPELLALYSEVEIIWMVRVAFLSFLFNGFVNPRVHVLEKEFQFGKAVLLKQGSAILGTIIIIILAFLLKSVWALVIGFGCSSFFMMLLSLIVCPFKPSFSFCHESFKEILSFAKGMFGLPILTYVAFNLDVLVAGKLFSADIVGMYGMALVLARSPQDIFNRIVTPILLPAFSEKQDDKQAICKAVLGLTRLITMLGVPLIVLAIVYGKQILTIVFGVEYSTVAASFGLLCVYSLLMTTATILANVFFSLGLPEKHRFFIVTSVVFLTIFIYPALKVFGVTGAALSLVLANFIALCWQVKKIKAIIGLKPIDYILCWLPGLCIGLLVLGFCQLLF